MEKIFGGYKVGEKKHSYGSVETDFANIQAEIEVDDIEEGLSFMRNYFGKNLPASPFFSWSYSDAKTAERRRELIKAIEGKKEEKADVVVKEVEVEVLCSCGHMVPKSLVMTASFGTCCPECYDRMSK